MPDTRLSMLPGLLSRGRATSADPDRHRRRRRRLGLAAAMALVGVAGAAADVQAASLSAPTAAHPGNKHKSPPLLGGAQPSPQRGAACPGTCPPNEPPPTNHGGPVQHNPKVVLIFWGPLWPSDSSTARAKANTIFSNLSGGPHQHILAEYTDSGGRVSDYPQTAVSVTDSNPADAPPSHMTGSGSDETAMDAEIARVSLAQSIPNTADTQWILFPQQGSVDSSAGFCGYHTADAFNSSTWVVAIIAYSSDIPGNGCQAYSPTNDVGEAMGVVATHEYFEAASDPYFTAWHNDVSPDGGENADVCRYYGGTTDALFVQYEWSPQSGTCLLASARCCTVVGSFATHWRAPGAAASLGTPTGEQYVSPTGFQQDFSNRKLLYNTGTLTWSTQLYAAAGGYVLDGYGGVHPYGDAVPAGTSAYWPGAKLARGIVTRPDHMSGYTLDLFGGVHQFNAPQEGSPVAQPVLTGYWPWGDVARGLALNPCDPTATQGYVLDLFGGIHSFGGAPGISGSAYWPWGDVARGISLDCANGSPEGFVLDLYGGVHTVGSAPAYGSSAYWPGWDIARAIVDRPDGSGGYVLDGWGGVHAFGNASPMGTPIIWPGWDIARGIVLTPDEAGGDTMDGWGGVHPYGSAGPANQSAYWPGWDIAKKIS